MPFLPDEYEVPRSGHYMRLDQGENRLRVLGPAVVGNVFWACGPDGNRRPLRRRMNEDIRSDELGEDQKGKPEQVKHFWAMPVWNYALGRVQIFEITQRTIMSAVDSLFRDSDWGDPADYDLKIIRKGSNFNDTEYQVNPAPKSPVPTQAVEELAGLTLDIEALFRGEDPFPATGAPDGPTAVTEPQTATQRVMIKSTKKVPMPRGKGHAFVIDTDQGTYGTPDESLGETIQSFGEAPVVFTYHTTGGGKRIVDKAEPEQELVGAGHVALDEDDIPF